MDLVSSLELRGGSVYTGTDSRGLLEADIAVHSGKVAAIARRRVDVAAPVPVLDVTGKVVAPGFIDAHSHSELAYTANVHSAAKIAQGVTSEICGMDGLSIGPARTDVARQSLVEILGPLLDGATPTVAASISDIWRLIENCSPPTRVGYAIPHAALRLSSNVPSTRPANAEELKSMGKELSDGLSKGAVGFSTGLIYAPNIAADHAELLSIARVCAHFDVPMIVHLRNEGLQIVNAVDEMLDITRSAGCSLHISHLKYLCRHHVANFYLALEKLETARRGGHNVTADQYPYSSSLTYLKSVLPRRFLKGSSEQLLERVRRLRIHGGLVSMFERPSSTSPSGFWEVGEDNRARTIGWQHMRFVGMLGEFRALNGLSIADAADAVGVEPADLLGDVLISERGKGMVISEAVPAEVVCAVLRLSWVAIGTDGIHVKNAHPRLFGTFPRVLGQFVRLKRVLTLSDALAKMTALPAEHYGLGDQVGRIAVGRNADMVVFDPQTISEPNEGGDAPTGISHVLVGGEVSVQGAKRTGRTLTLKKT